MSRQFTVEGRAAGQRLDVVLAGWAGISRNQARQQLDAGLVAVNGNRRPASYLVQASDRIAVTEAKPASTSPAAPTLPIVYQDADLIVVDKPAGLSVHPGAGTAGQSTVADFARLHTTDHDTERPGIVHRLDKDTSGLLMIAKSAAVKVYLQGQLASHAITKKYIALLVGRLEPEAATIDLPLGRDAANPLRQAVVRGGRTARTHYRVMAYYPGYTFVEANLETGRTHQLRVHFAATGHPIAGDTTYGPPARPLGLRRQFLHAAQLRIVTRTGQILELSSSLPPDLQDCLSQLEDSV